MTTFKFILALVVILLIADFGWQNWTTVPIKYRFGLEGEPKVFTVILASIFIGFVIAWTAEHLSSLKVKREARRLRKRIVELESELEGYREKELLQPETGERDKGSLGFRSDVRDKE